MPENSERKSDVEASENEKKRYGLKNRAISASSRLRRSLSIRKGKRKVEGRGACVSIKDVRDNKEVQAVQAFRETLLSNELLPAKHDDYYMLLRREKHDGSMAILTAAVLVLKQFLTSRLSPCCV